MCDMEEKTALVIEDHSEHYKIGENLPSFKAASRKMAEENFDAVKIYDEYVRFASAYV